ISTGSSTETTSRPSRTASDRHRGIRTRALQACSRYNQSRLGAAPLWRAILGAVRSSDVSKFLSRGFLLANSILISAVPVSSAAGQASPCFPIDLRSATKPTSHTFERDATAIIPRMGHRPTALPPSDLLRRQPLSPLPPLGPGLPPPTLAASFVGIAQDGLVPPDPDCAIGPNHLAHVVNVLLRITNKSGTELFLGDLSAGGGFWSGMGVTGFTADPKVMYDQYSDRFVVAMIEVFSGFSGSALLLAVSATNDPTGVWNRYR